MGLCDFGVSRCVDEFASLSMTRGVGTPLYIAPEVLEGTTYNFSADVFSFGICLWQLHSRQEPYSGINYMQVVPRILEGMRPTPISGSPFSGLQESCWSAEPSTRPSFVDIVSTLKTIRARKSQLGGGGRRAKKKGEQLSGKLRVSKTDIEFK